ncbi:MAG: N-acetylmuramoyl-L-alanine amidase, partial [Paracoccus sp. (in: a-proteobacteria)]|nr:N-acetylmuramoyl-L-alanine amidase [Paracoccus sp. (in: a-proteobacteria)]
LIGAIMARWQIPPAGVIGHSDMAPGRKIDPGPRFDWARLAGQGLATHPAPPLLSPETAPPLAESLAAIGYGTDAPPEALLHAFRLRFRPGATGPESAADRQIAAAAARAFAEAREKA